MNSFTEPRKIAHKILTIREDVSGEIIRDLGAVSIENDEAIRFATKWAKDGREEAQKSRKPSRMRSEGEATPLRDNNYMEFDVMVSKSQEWSIDIMASEHFIMLVGHYYYYYLIIVSNN